MVSLQSYIEITPGEKSDSRILIHKCRIHKGQAHVQISVCIHDLELYEYS